MTQSDLYKAALAMFAARAAGEKGSLEQQKAIAYCIRNRVKAGWNDGNWLAVIEDADDFMGNLPGPRVRLDANGRAFVRLLRDIDEIYYGGQRFAGQTGNEEGDSLESAVGNAKFWLFLSQPFNPWFVEHIIHAPDSHPNRGQMGLMQFFD